MNKTKMKKESIVVDLVQHARLLIPIPVCIDFLKIDNNKSSINNITIIMY